MSDVFFDVVTGAEEEEDEEEEAEAEAVEEEPVGSPEEEGSESSEK